MIKNITFTILKNFLEREGSVYFNKKNRLYFFPEGSDRFIHGPVYFPLYGSCVYSYIFIFLINLIF